MKGAVFYVYEHWRPDTGKCFYVGKGHGARSHEMRRRNIWHRKIVSFLNAHGLGVDVRIVASSLRECDALALEIEIIARRKAAGEKIVNVTLGGDGVSGLVHTEKTKELIRVKRARQTVEHSPETRAKIGAANSIALRRPNPEHSERMRGRKLSEQHRQAIGAGNRGRVVTQQTRDKISAANTGKSASDQTRARLRESHLGYKHKIDTRKKMSDAQKQLWDQRDRAAHSAAVLAALSTQEAKAKMSSAGLRRMGTPEMKAKAREWANKRWAAVRAAKDQGHAHGNSGPPTPGT